MKITKQIEAEILQFMDDYWGSYLNGDLQTWASYLPDDFRNIGTTKAEIWNSKQEIVDFTEKVLDQMVGMVEPRNKKTQIIPYAPYFMVHELSDLYVKAEEGWVFYAPIRLSSLLEKTADGWKIIHQHASYPDVKADEGETIGFDELKAENKKLREAIQARTIELERKNRELEIEAAVERVRAEAMAMHAPEDFGKVARQLLQQVQNLSLKGFTEATIYLIDESEFFNCYDFSSFGNMEDAKNQFLSYDAKKFPLLGRYPLNQWKKGERYFELDFDFEKLQAATKEFEEINVNVADALKEALTSGHLTHQWEACGRLSNGFIAFDMTNPPNDDARNITVKMTHAFEQAYIRFLDLQKAEAQARKIKLVNQENERLLHSILPQPIAEQIRSGRHNVVKRFEEVSILFADIVGFTALSEKLKPGQVVDILNGLFSKFDDLTDQYGLEKIKTIGDAYMVAAGVPEKRVDHALTIFRFAQDMLRSLEGYNQENNSRMKIRIGISSGPVVAGVIGKKKFAYDLWGDSVNTAARMEAYGREGNIQVSPTSYELLKNGFAFEKIPGVNIKGKGVMDVYLWKA